MFWQKRIDLSLIWLIIILLIALAAAFMVGWMQGREYLDLRALNQESHQKGYKYISPLLTCGDVKLSGIENREFRDDLSSLINKKISDGEADYISLYFRDLNNGPWVGINEKEKFSPASLLKVPLMMAYLKLAESDPGLLAKKIKIDRKSGPGLVQNISPDKEVKDQEEYTIEELINRMIAYSDNLAADTLYNNLSADKIGEIYLDLNVQVPSPDRQENFMTVQDYASFFRILYNSSYLSRDMSEKALKILSTSSFKNGLEAGLPAGTEIAHKFGERELAEGRQLHDCGIVYQGERNYLICIMTRGQDLLKMENTIQDLSALVYKEFNASE